MSDVVTYTAVRALSSRLSACSLPRGYTVYVLDGVPWLVRGPAVHSVQSEFAAVRMLSSLGVDVRVDLRDFSFPADAPFPLPVWPAVFAPIVPLDPTEQLSRAQMYVQHRDAVVSAAKKVQWLQGVPFVFTAIRYLEGSVV